MQLLQVFSAHLFSYQFIIILSSERYTYRSFLWTYSCPLPVAAAWLKLIQASGLERFFALSTYLILVLVQTAQQAALTGPYRRAIRLEVTTASFRCQCQIRNCAVKLRGPVNPKDAFDLDMLVDPRLLRHYRDY